MESLRKRDAHLVNNWYVACLSKELKKKPLQRLIYDHPLVLFRNPAGKVTCLPDRCLHRHAFLSGGEILKGQLICPYHGWAYNQEGEVVCVPSEGPGQSPASSLKLKPFPCVEQDGVIWVWTGVDDLTVDTPPWRFPEAENTKWINYFMVTDFENEVTHLAENFLDVPHTIFVHRGWFRDEKAQAKKVPTLVETESGVVKVTYFQKEDEFSWGAQLLLNPGRDPMIHTDEFIMPNLTRVDYSFGEKNRFIINSQITPISTLKSRVYTYIAYKVPILGVLLKPLISFYTRKVIDQDVAIMKNQGDSFRLNPKTAFRSTEADEVHKEIERLRFYGVKGDEKAKSYKGKKEINFWI